MGGTPLRIASVGECTMDQYLDLEKEYVGGISLNFAVNCKRAGAGAVSLISRIGDDHKIRILRQLEKEGVDVSHIVTQPGATARQKISLTSEGDRVFPPGGYDSGVLDGFLLDEETIKFVQSHNVIAAPLFTQIEPLFRQVMNSEYFEGWRIADFLDLTDYGKDIGIVEKLSDRLTIAFLSGDEEMVEKLRPLSRESQCLMILTLGSEGSVALLKGEPLYQSSIHVTNIVDSTGCGDAFQAAFTVSYWRDGSIRRALLRGAQQAARVLQHHGAIG
jgi:fructoselysine 6-kinase